MKRNYSLLLILLAITFKGLGQDVRTINFPKTRELVQDFPAKNNTWVFLMAGQSNMAGRGFVEPSDTLSNERILSINSEGELVYAKEPFHWYEPIRTGLDCGMSFAQTILQEVPDNIKIVMIPVAIGGSAMGQWLGDSTYRGVNLFSNFKEKVALAQNYGEIKCILWHQGESDANEQRIPNYSENLAELFKRFRNTIGQEALPIITGELGAYSNDDKNWQEINFLIHEYAAIDANTTVINTQDLVHKGDFIHFNSEGQREIGKRFAHRYLEIANK